MSTVTFEIRITDFNEEYFALTVTDAPSLGPDLALKSFPIAKRTLTPLIDNASLDLLKVISSKDGALRTHGSAADRVVEQYGRDLFDLVIWSQPRELTGSWEIFANLQEQAKRLRLCVANKAAALPWEAMRDDHRSNGCLAKQFSVVRYVPTSPPLQPLDLEAEPLRMLVVFADPDGGLTKASAIKLEQEAIGAALQSTVSRGDLYIDFIDAGSGKTLDLIKDRLAVNRYYHILHYFGHGHSSLQGRLEFEGARHGEPQSVGWGQLQPILKPIMSHLRLIILNACELAQPDAEFVEYSPFSSLAESFLNAGAAMVIAMQYPVRTDTATRFTGEFYKHLASCLFETADCIEDAVVRGRTAIDANPNAVEWITPVVFTRVPAGPIFRFGALHRANALYETGLWVNAARKVKEVLNVQPMSQEGLQLKRGLYDKAKTFLEQGDLTGHAILNALE